MVSQSLSLSIRPTEENTNKKEKSIECDQSHKVHRFRLARTQTIQIFSLNSFLELIISERCLFPMIYFIFSFFHSIVSLTWEKTKCFPQVARLRVSTSFLPTQCYWQRRFYHRSVTHDTHRTDARWEWWRKIHTTHTHTHLLAKFLENMLI